MANGTTKPIKDAKVGDKVIATDPAGWRACSADSARRPHQPRHGINRPHGQGQRPRRVIHTTQHHQVWDASKKMWVDADGLAADDELRTTEKTTNNVIDIANFDGARSMYDLTVDTTHTCYVLAGSTPVLSYTTAERSPAMHSMTPSTTRQRL
jgi:hypothetical protein